MAAATGLPKSPGSDEIQAEINAVLASDPFLRAPSLAQFLSYVCRKALSGQANEIKEYNIAVEAFGRQPNFDQKVDAIVRVEAHRLRKRLKQYYDTEGAGHSVQIVIPPGQYVPTFVMRSLEAASEAPGRTEVHAITAPLPFEPAGMVQPEPGPPLVTPEAGSRRRFHRVLAYLLGGLVVLLLAAGVFVFRRPASSPASALPASPETVPLVIPEDGIRIACGLSASKYIDANGSTWIADRYFAGGRILKSPGDPISRTRDPHIYQARREGSFRYDIPLQPGIYEIHLYFAERTFGENNLGGGGEGSRLFSLFLNGNRILDRLDVLSDAQGANTADVKVFKDVRPSPDGFLHMQFTPYKENAFLNGIEILPGVPGKMRSIHMVAGSNPVRDSSGQLWTADQYCSGGIVIARSSNVAGTTVPELYRSERYGNFNYAIPVTPGRYAVKMYFAERWFGSSTPDGGGAGSRVFDIYANGAVLLNRFDIYRAGGGENRAVEKTFRGLMPNAQGKLALSFVPVENYAVLNALEIEPEQ